MNYNLSTATDTSMDRRLSSMSDENGTYTNNSIAEQKFKLGKKACTCLSVPHNYEVPWVDRCDDEVCIIWSSLLLWSGAELKEGVASKDIAIPTGNKASKNFRFDVDMIVEEQASGDALWLLSTYHRLIGP